MKELNYRAISIGLLMALLILSGIFNRSCQRNESKQKEYEQIISDTIEYYRGRNGEQIAKINVLRINNKKQFLKLSTKDSTIKWLQSTVSEYKGKLESATVLSNDTRVLGVSETEIEGSDTVIQDSLVFVYPKYKTSWENKWEIGQIKATKDSVYRDIKIRNEFEITLGEEKKSWFKKDTYKIKVVNLNPNTVTREMRTFEVTEKPKRFGIGFQTGVGITNSLTPSYYIGVGINYNIITF